MDKHHYHRGKAFADWLGDTIFAAFLIVLLLIVALMLFG